MPYIITAAVVILICFLIGLFIVFSIIKPTRRSLLETRLMEEESYPGLMDFYEKSLTSNYKIKSKYGYELQAYYLKNKEETNKFIVMAHGHTYTHHGCLKYARMMMKYGYNIVLFDERFHGDSGGNFTTLGYFEKDDLYTVISDTISRYGEDISIGTYGESMGAATALLEAKFDKRVKFIISDCGFSDFSLLLRQLLWSRYRIPVYPFYWFAVIVFKLITRASMTGISPIKAIKDISVPIMFVHGLADDYIPYTHTEAMYNTYNGKKKIYLAKNNALHAGSYLADEENYEKEIKEFMEKYIN